MHIIENISRQKRNTLGEKLSQGIFSLLFCSQLLYSVEGNTREGCNFVERQGTIALHTIIYVASASNSACSSFTSSIEKGNTATISSREFLPSLSIARAASFNA